MAYVRVIPRDLFNEANLLKCYGQLYLELEKLGMEDCIHGRGFKHGHPFMVRQDESDGSIFIENIYLVVRDRDRRLYRHLNSRDHYPLYMHMPENDDDIRVFNEDGSLTEEMIEFLKGTDDGSTDPEET